MLLFQRLKRTLSSGIDALLEDIENHEAVVVATIHEVERHAGTVTAHRTECEAHIARLEERARALEDEARVWRGRARALAGERDRALECVRRMRAAAQARRDALRTLEGQRALLDAVGADERAIAEKLEELKQRRVMLRSRQARTEAANAVPERASVDDVLIRWEARVAKNEALQSTVRGRDPGALSVTRIEEPALVSADLDRLLTEEDR